MFDFDDLMVCLKTARRFSLFWPFLLANFALYLAYMFPIEGAYTYTLKQRLPLSENESTPAALL